jgi:hypothetical protein
VTLARPVHIRLADASGGNPFLAHKSPPQTASPFLLFGSAASLGPLPNGVYYEAEEGRPRYQQNCRCHMSGKRKKGCDKVAS